MYAKRLVASTYLQYVLNAIGALLLFTFLRQLGGVLLTFLLATILVYMLNPLVRWLKVWRVPRVVAVLGVFVALVMAVLVALLLLILPTVGQVQALVQNPAVLTDGATRLSDWAIACFTFGSCALLIGLWASVTEIIPVLGTFLGAVPAVLIALFSEQLEGNVLVPRIVGSSVGMHPLWILFVVSITATAFRYLNGMLLFERWQKVPIVKVVSEGNPKVAASGGEPAGLRGSIGREG